MRGGEGGVGLDDACLLRTKERKQENRLPSNEQCKS